VLYGIITIFAMYANSSTLESEVLVSQGGEHELSMVEEYVGSQNVFSE